MIPLARAILLLGILLIIVSGILYLVGRSGLPLGRLPGDFRIQAGNVTIFFPLATMILLSVILTILLNLLARLLRK